MAALRVERQPALSVAGTSPAEQGVPGPRGAPGERAEHTLLTGKLRPGLLKGRRLSTRVRGLMAPRPGALVLVHAAAGYGKTTALAATREPGCLWYNLDHGDRDPVTLTRRLSIALGVEPPGPAVGSHAEAMALELADRLQGSSPTITFDQWERLGDAPDEAGALLGELLVQLPALSVRLGTRTRPALRLERLRLEDRLVEIGPGQLRLDREQITDLLAEAWGREPEATELEFADRVLEGWPAALHLWLAGPEGGGGPSMRLVQGTPLHHYVQDEVLARTLGHDGLRQLRSSCAWLVGRGPIVERAFT
ncbi:MAG TPA: hypothetical protein VLW53_04225, partial [Candidatus Eisenbacteria bacterium]|nr:hypothetical protein [Candidatus Eisenbacteria bacterium]